MLDWLLTYVLHSTVAASATLAALALLRQRGLTPAVRVVMLRAALLGPLVTATAAAFTPGGWPGAASFDGSQPARSIIALPQAGQLPARSSGEPRALASESRVATVAERGRAAASSDRSGESAASGALLAVLPGFSAAVGLLALLHLVLRALAGARRLARRRVARDAAAEARAAALRGAPVRLSECPGLATPLALGRSEVVLPTGALAQLPEGERDALLAHEIAHLARRDTLWSGLARLAAALTAAQPLQHLLLRRLEDETELAADAWAVRRTRRPLELARCLERVGARLAPVGAARRVEPFGGVAVARRTSALVRRVEELCVASADAPAPRTGLASTAAFALVVVAACGSPAVRGDDGIGQEEEAVTALGGDDAFEMFRAQMRQGIDHFDPAGQKLWKKQMTSGGSVDFTPHGWDPRSPELHFEADRTPSGDTRIRSFGQDFAGVKAVDVFLKRLYQERQDIRISIDPTDDVAFETVTGLVDAALEAGFTHVVVSRDRGYPETEESFVETHEDPSMTRTEEFAAVATRDEELIGPYAVRSYGGPDAEEGERRYTLRLLEHGGVDRLPQDRVVDSSWVLGHLRDGMRRGPLGDTGLVALQDRVVLEGHANTPFSFAQAWMGNLARPDLLAYKIELALVGEEPVSAFLPFDLDPVAEEIEEGAEAVLQEGPQEGPLEVRVVQDDGRTVYQIGPRRVSSHERAAADALRLAARLKPANLVVVHPSRESTFTDVVPLVRELRAGGVAVAFTGAIAGPNLDRSLRGEGR